MELDHQEYRRVLKGGNDLWEIYFQGGDRAFQLRAARLLSPRHISAV